ncbi:P2Y purinoceptor 1-like [Pelobates cultripes]|uniref:P2Y purinoceptor 1-like n=1 Tax=Pelobates cultripes TaxID=61616 RepID=A0AAD1SN60_PELCU|nr:P2Y purinoceptor 1-like [Pelobates cultripes]CAH2302917.1 P2Y purinoceptor 1-like [Pelobates cultripes]
MEDFFQTAFTTSNSNLSVACLVNKEFTFRFLSSVYIIVFIIGLLGNGFGLWNLAVNWKKWTSLNVFVLNLGIADLLYVATLPFFVSYYLNKEQWVFGYSFCRLARCLFHVNMYASISFLTCISVQRYLGIVHPMKMMGRFQNLRPSFYISILIWIWVIIQIVPHLHFTNALKNNTFCYDSTTNDFLSIYTPYSLIITFTGFLIPFIIIVICYIRVLSVLKKNTNVDPNLKQRSIKLVFIVLTLFFLCFFPYYTFRNLNLLARVWQLQGTCTQTLRNVYVSYQVTRGLASLNSAINPLVYLVTNENFISKFRRIRRRAWHKFVNLGRSQRLPESKTLNENVNNTLEEACEQL